MVHSRPAQQFISPDQQQPAENEQEWVLWNVVGNAMVELVREFYLMKDFETMLVIFVLFWWVNSSLQPLNSLLGYSALKKEAEVEVP